MPSRSTLQNQASDLTLNLTTIARPGAVAGGNIGRWTWGGQPNPQDDKLQPRELGKLQHLCSSGPVPAGNGRKQRIFRKLFPSGHQAPRDFGIVADTGVTVTAGRGMQGGQSQLANPPIRVSPPLFQGHPQILLSFL